MTIGALSTAFFNNLSRNDISRIQADLADLNRQTASGYKAADVMGYGATAGRILSARGLITQYESYASTASALDGRFQAIDLSIGRAADAAETLRLNILNAIGSGDGRFVADALSRAFDGARAAMNEDYQGEALFAGERVTADPINVSTLAQLAAAPSTASIFTQASRARTINLGEGPFQVAERASDLSTGLFDTMRTLKQFVDTQGGSLPQTLTTAQITALQAAVTGLTTARDTLVIAQGRNGEVQKRVEADGARMSTRADALAKTVSDQADADLAEVAMKISSKEVQYQAVAQTFVKLSQLSLLNFLQP
jgi:flagellar hook-associated protein 3 FlgL